MTHINQLASIVIQPPRGRSLGEGGCDTVCTFQHLPFCKTANLLWLLFLYFLIGGMKHSHWMSSIRPSSSLTPSVPKKCYIHVGQYLCRVSNSSLEGPESCVAYFFPCSTTNDSAEDLCGNWHKKLQRVESRVEGQPKNVQGIPGYTINAVGG